MVDDSNRRVIRYNRDGGGVRSSGVRAVDRTRGLSTVSRSTTPLAGTRTATRGGSRSAARIDAGRALPSTNRARGGRSSTASRLGGSNLGATRARTATRDGRLTARTAPATARGLTTAQPRLGAVRGRDTLGRGAVGTRPVPARVGGGLVAPTLRNRVAPTLGTAFARGSRVGRNGVNRGLGYGGLGFGHRPFGFGNQRFGFGRFGFSSYGLGFGFGGGFGFDPWCYGGFHPIGFHNRFNWWRGYHFSFFQRCYSPFWRTNCIGWWPGRNVYVPTWWLADPYVSAPVANPVINVVVGDGFAGDGLAGGGFIDEGGDVIVVGGGSVAVDPAPEATPTPADESRMLQEVGDSMFLGGRYQEAAATYEQARGLTPENGFLLDRLADTAFATGDYHYAAFLIREALRVQPDLASLEMDKRLRYPNPDELKTRLASLEAYLTTRPYDAASWTVLAYNRRFSGNPDGARTALGKVLGIDPDHAVAQALLAGMAKGAAGATPGGAAAGR